MIVILLMMSFIQSLLGPTLFIDVRRRVQKWSKTDPHQVLLGMFKDGFFIQLGPTSEAAPELNALCTWIGKLFARQSDHNLPKTQFGNGIQRGKLMGKEMAGILLLLAAVLQTSAGKKILESGSRNSKFKSDIVCEDWVLLLETLLTWEAHLTQDRSRTSTSFRRRRPKCSVCCLLNRIRSPVPKKKPTGSLIVP